MPPALRSSSRSAPGTPIGRSSGVTTPSSTPGRKVPHCKTCGKPRAGHPRSGCKSVNINASPEVSDEESTEPEDDNISNALGSIRLNTPMLASPIPDREEENKQFIRNRRRSSIQQMQLAAATTLESLSSESSELIRKILTDPTLFDKDTDDEADYPEKRHKNVVRWQETLQYIPPLSNKNCHRVRKQLMPGTLDPPSPESSFNSQISMSKMETPVPSSIVFLAPTKPLIRTMSAIEREDFLSFVTSKSSTTVYTVPTADIQNIVQEASRHKFHAETVADDDADESFLVVGRDEKAVKKVADNITKSQEHQRDLEQREQALRIKEKELEEQKTDAGKGGSALRAAAGGAVVGAVGTFASLAFT